MAAKSVQHGDNYGVCVGGQEGKRTEGDRLVTSVKDLSVNHTYPFTVAD